MNNSPYHKLIALLTKEKIDYFIIPATDEYGFEFTPEYNKRLLYFTEFTGSAGTAVICRNGKSFFFTDGRYLTQAAQELNPANFIVKDITKEPVGQWLQNNITNHETFGYCPELHTSRAIELLGLHATKHQIKVALIDKLLTNKPEKLLTNIASYQINFAGQGSAAKRDVIFKALKIQCPALITEPALVCWALNLRGADLPTTPVAMCHAILYPNGNADLFVNKHQICFDAARKKIRIFDIVQLPQCLSQFGLEQQHMAVDQSIATAAMIDRLKQNKIKIIDINNADIWQIAIVKSQREIDLACSMHIYDGAAVTKLLAWIKQNFNHRSISEQQAAERLLHYRMLNKNFISPSFPTISAYGPNSAIIHYSGWNNAVLKHGLYLVDSGGQYLGATTDVTRTIALGTPTMQQQTQYTLVLKGMLALAKQPFPTGTMAHQLDSFARQHLWQHGYDYPHGTGHGVGNFLNVHEPPNISTRPSKFTIRPHIIVSNEPGVYFPSEYGIRIENLMYSKILSERFLSFVQLTCIPFDYDLILPEMLSAQEKEWLNQYNSWLKHSLAAHLTHDERLFLQQHTVPL